MKVSNLIHLALVIIVVAVVIVAKVTINQRDTEISKLRLENDKYYKQYYVERGKEREANARERMVYLHHIDSINLRNKGTVILLDKTTKELKAIKGRYSNRTDLGNLMDSIANGK